MAIETLSREITKDSSAERISLWLRSNPPAGLLTKSDAEAIAIIASLFYLGVDLSDWCQGKKEIARADFKRHSFAL